MDEVEKMSARRTLLYISVVLTAIVTLVLGIVVANSSESEARQYEGIQDVLEMLHTYDVDILLFNSRQNDFLLIQESADIEFQDTSGRVEAIINTFATLDDRDSWLELSRDLDGVAVTRGDELWAVSVDSDLPNSRDVAERLANALNGNAHY